MSLPDWNAKASLWKEDEKGQNPRLLQDRNGTFASLIRDVMAMHRPADSQHYSIMVGEDIFRYDQIEDISKQPDFPKS